MRSSASAAIIRKLSFVMLAAVMAIAVVSVAGNAEADNARKVFAPDAVINPSAFYPEGPQLIDEGLLVAEMARDRIVLIANGGERKTVWQAEGCGPTSIKRIPSGGYWV